MATPAPLEIQKPLDEDGLAFIRLASHLDRSRTWHGKQLTEAIDVLALMARNCPDTQVADRVGRQRGYVRSTRTRLRKTFLEPDDPQVV